MSTNFRTRKVTMASNQNMIKPSLMEKKVIDNEAFARLSARFKAAFGNDKKDQRELVLPISGYSGHRRGNKSQNFFGKTFREQAIQSKQLERSFRSNSLNN